MATTKQIALRMKYAKTTINKLTKQLSLAKAKAKSLEADLKKVKAAEGKKTVKKVTKKAAPKKKAKK
jgi:hypothetical protein